MLDIRWLEDLVVIAETRNFTRASEIRNITQSGLSRRIQALEHWVGASLLDRSQSPFDLTEAGYKMLDIANGVLGQLNGGRRAIRDDMDRKARTITFAAPHILSVSFFPRWFPTLNAEIDSVRFSVISDHLPECAAALEDGTVDFVVCFVDEKQQIFKRARKPFDLHECTSIVIGREQLIPLSAPRPDGSPQHRLDSDSQTPTSYLAYCPECSLGWAVEDRLSSVTGLPPLTNLYENSLADALRTMTLSGLGVAWLPLSVTHQDILRGKLVRTGTRDLDINLQVRIYRPPRKISKKAEELWMKLMREQSVLDLTSMSDSVSADRSTGSAGGKASRAVRAPA